LHNCKDIRYFSSVFIVLITGYVNYFNSMDSFVENVKISDNFTLLLH
jgi:hypothetical protein